VVLNKSLIWDHGTDYVDVENANHYAWRRLYCFKNYLVSMKQDATSNTRRHLRVTHDINLDSVRKRSREVFNADLSESLNSHQDKGIMRSQIWTHFDIISLDRW
jgi:hypothetical protein